MGLYHFGNVAKSFDELFDPVVARINSRAIRYTSGPQAGERRIKIFADFDKLQTEANIVVSLKQETNRNEARIPPKHTSLNLQDRLNPNGFNHSVNIGCERVMHFTPPYLSVQRRLRF